MATKFGALPAMEITATGFGAGSRDIDGLPNCTQVVVGDGVASMRVIGQPLVLLEANLDDATGEVLAHAVETLLAAGALDAWITPIVMKKGRPGHTVSVLVDTALAESVRAVLEDETGTLGVRGSALERWAASRSMGAVDVDGSPVRVKVSPGRVKAEQRDAARAARRSGLPLREVLYRAENNWRQEDDARPGRQPPDTDEPPEDSSPA
jgi:uncharacterized protein (DUF111 family)